MHPPARTTARTAERTPENCPVLPPHIRAVVLDIDSVITDLFHVRAAAWTCVLDAYVEAFAPGAGLRGPEPETELPRFLDGTRLVGALVSFLEARGLEAGSFGEAAEAARVLAIRQQDMLQRYLHHYGVGIRRGTGELLEGLRRRGVACAAVSGTAGARGLLASRGLLPLIDVVLDGDDQGHRRVTVRPDPALPLRAVRLLGAGPQETAVVDGSPYGVEAAARGGFGRIVGLTPAGDAHRMAEMFHRGADVVAHDLGDLGAAPRAAMAATA
ncbi:HAD family phosphatase [Streptomyces luteireticuli]|uniref:HAD family hydrolase n=1 Tax=Streptomyces luteireticuli TaxID=173858 RepID=A0ABN0YWQ8_9ACTN